jgi:uncharacterized membrane protein
MSYTSKHAAIAALIWFIILIGLILTVTVPGAARFADPDYKILRLLTAVIILPGFVLNGWLGYKTKKARSNGQIDERDFAIERRASEITLIVVAIAVYLSSLLLYETHSQDGTVSRGWLYLMAYGTAALVSFTHALSSLILDRVGWTNA